MPPPSTTYVALSFGVLALVIIVPTRIKGISQEGRRRIGHATSGQGLICISYILPVSWSIIALWLAASLLVCLVYMHPTIYLQIFRPMLRSHELEKNVLPGAFYFLAGMAVTASFFDMNTARYSLLCLSWADPMAAWIGQSIKSPMLAKGTSLAGCLGCFVTAWIMGYLMLDDWARITMGAAVCMLVEAMPIGDDNFAIPIATATAVTVSVGW
jgi:dolichol kinase